jgi:hypothetical protein
MLEIIASRGSKRWAGIQLIITKTKTKQRRKMIREWPRITRKIPANPSPAGNNNGVKCD